MNYLTPIHLLARGFRGRPHTDPRRESHSVLTDRNRRGLSFRRSSGAGCQASARLRVKPPLPGPGLCVSEPSYASRPPGRKRTFHSRLHRRALSNATFTVKRPARSLLTGPPPASPCGVSCRVRDALCVQHFPDVLRHRVLSPKHPPRPAFYGVCSRALTPDHLQTPTPGTRSPLSSKGAAIGVTP